MDYLNIPGLYNSGEGHWQTHWEKIYPETFSRVQQRNWEAPAKREWVQQLEQEIQKLQAPTLLVAHSLGCITAVHWASECSSPLISGILLVAPADVEKTTNQHLKTFSPVPLNRLNFPGIVVASMNDPYGDIQRAAQWAAHWRTRFVCIGNKGHINSQSNLNDWREGLLLLAELEFAAMERQYKHAS